MKKIKFNHSRARKCEVEGCTKPHYAHGLCQAHYTIEYRKSLKRVFSTEKDQSK